MTSSTVVVAAECMTVVALVVDGGGNGNGNGNGDANVWEPY